MLKISNLGTRSLLMYRKHCKKSRKHIQIFILYNLLLLFFETAGYPLTAKID